MKYLILPERYGSLDFDIYINCHLKNDFTLINNTKEANVTTYSHRHTSTIQAHVCQT